MPADRFSGRLEVEIEGAHIEELPNERRRSGLDGLAVTDEQGLEVQSRELGYRALGASSTRRLASLLLAAMGCRLVTPNRCTNLANCLMRFRDRVRRC